jgi:sugar-specific transcriptional regulator TrmB
VRRDGGRELAVSEGTDLSERIAVLEAELEAVTQELFESNRSAAWFAQERQNAVDNLNRHLVGSDHLAQDELRRRLEKQDAYIAEIEAEFSRRENKYWQDFGRYPKGAFSPPKSDRSAISMARRAARLIKNILR